MMRTKAIAADIEAEGATGEFSAIVAVFNNIDSVGDRILPGAFTKTLDKWRQSGDPIPIIVSHRHDDLNAHVGIVEPDDAEETERGLLVHGRLDVGDNATAATVHRLMKRRSLKEFSFGYRVPIGGETKAKDGANEISVIDLIELGPCLRGANSATELLGVKSGLAPPPSDAELRERAAELGLGLDPLRQRSRDITLKILMGEEWR